jgi:hypothetical protein
MVGRGGKTLSDIRLEFEWYDIALVALMIGWPGLLIGAVAGALAWRRRRLIGTLLGALAGLALWVGVQFAWA